MLCSAFSVPVHYLNGHFHNPPLPQKCSKHKIQCFDVEHGIYFTLETGYFNIFTRALHS